MQITVLSDGFPPWDRGGEQKIAARLAEGYAERGHEVGGVTDRWEAGWATANGAAVRTLWTPKPRSILPYLTFNPFVVRSVERALDAFGPDVAHAHNVHYLSNAAVRAATNHGPVVKTYHDAGTVSYGERATWTTRRRVGPSRPPITRSARGDNFCGRDGDTTRSGTTGIDKPSIAISNPA